MSALIEFQSVCKYYQMGDTTVKAADHISFQIQKGEFVATVGQSGSGKSTCMNIIGCLDVPTSGAYLLDGQDVGRMDRNQLAEIRNKMLGFIFQQYNLLPKLNLQENVEVPLMYAGVPKAERHERAKLALELVGLGDKLKHKPNQLSGGQQQRVSIARALAADPEKEVEAGYNILRAVGFPVAGPEVITCPTCGRTQYPCTEIANEVERRLQGCKKSIKVAVMGCVVNGPGEAREADIGIAGGKGEAVLFVHGEPVRKLTGDNILDQFMEEIYKL